MSRFTVIECDQRSDAWHLARCGRVTGSGAQAVLAKGKNGAEATTRYNYRIQLAVERMTGKPQESTYTNKYMQDGVAVEPTARLEYEAQTGYIVRETGFLSMTEHMAGCSLDGDVDDFQGLVSFKCPMSATHAEYLKARRLPPEYVRQATHEMWVTGAQWYDFCSYDARFPEGLKFFRVRVERSEFKAELATYEAELARFLSEVETEVKTLEKLRAA